MRWDYKLVYYLLLTYFMYGLFNWFSLGDFVVPLPLSFVFAFIIPVAYLFATKPSLYNLLYLSIPLLLFKDLVIYYNENIGIGLILTSLTAFVALGIILLTKKAKNRLISTNGILFTIAPILLIGNNILSVSYIALTALLTFRNIQSEFIKHIPLERALLTSLFIQVLFLLNECSNWLVKTF